MGGVVWVDILPSIGCSPIKRYTNEAGSVHAYFKSPMTS